MFYNHLLQQLARFSGYFSVKKTKYYPSFDVIIVFRVLFIKGENPFPIRVRCKLPKLINTQQFGNRQFD